MGIWRNKKKSFFIPSYDELSLFMMSTAFLLVFFTSGTFRSKIHGFLSEVEDAFWVIVLVTIYGGGLILSLYHVFTEREKNQLEKYAMVVFAVLTNAISGIAASIYILDNSADAPCVFVLLPIWNIINCIILLALLRKGIINYESMSDEDVRPFEALLGFIVITGVFAVCQYAIKLYWAITFSICVIYATSFSDALGFIFHREGRAAVEIARIKGEEICGYCERPITKDETAWVINKSVIVCKECYEKYGGKKSS